MNERNRKKTAFITEEGLLEFKICPSHFARRLRLFNVDTNLAELKWRTCLVYLDDVVVLS